MRGGQVGGVGEADNRKGGVEQDEGEEGEEEEIADLEPESAGEDLPEAEGAEPQEFDPGGKKDAGRDEEDEEEGESVKNPAATEEGDGAVV